MPTYEYECKSCKYTFDVFQSMSDDPLRSCPKCGKEVRRLINGGNGIIFKGSGFYVTDKNGGSGNKGKSEEFRKESSVKNAGTESTSCSGCAKSETPACPKKAS